MTKRILYNLKKNKFFHFIIFITVVVHGVLLLKYNVICYEKNDQYQTVSIPNIEQTSENEADIVFEDERNILILYDDINGRLDGLNAMIQEKMMCDICKISHSDSVQLEQYDLVLLGNVVIDEKPSETMQQFLEEYDFSGLDVAPYWVGEAEYEQFESLIQSYINNGDLLSGIGFNGDELSETEEISYFLDEWLTTVYTSS